MYIRYKLLVKNPSVKGDNFVLKKASWMCLRFELSLSTCLFFCGFNLSGVQLIIFLYIFAIIYIQKLLVKFAWWVLVKLWSLKNVLKIILKDDKKGGWELWKFSKMCLSLRIMLMIMDLVEKQVEKKLRRMITCVMNRF